MNAPSSPHPEDPDSSGIDAVCVHLPDLGIPTNQSTTIEQAIDMDLDAEANGNTIAYITDYRNAATTH